MPRRLARTKVTSESTNVPVSLALTETNVGEAAFAAERTSSKRKSRATDEDEEKVNVDHERPSDDPKILATKKRKTKGAAAKEDDGMALAARSSIASLKRAMCIGAHVSGAGGVHNAIKNATQIGANSFGLFLKSQRKWTSPPLEAIVKDQFHALAKEHGFDVGKHVLPHGSYLVNLAQADKTKADQAYANLVDDLDRCDALGIKLYNLHPGSTGGGAMKDATDRIAAQLNKAHKATRSVVTVIENMCGSGNVVGSRFEELRDIIDKVDDKTRVGVCIDTCHAFAAGYDLRTPEAFSETMTRFDDVVGIKYLKALHINDSKAPLASHRDLHYNIGHGFLGLRAFHNVVNYPFFENLPLVLETPIDIKGPDGKTLENKQIWADEIKLLESLVGVEWTPELDSRAAKLQAKGAAERSKIEEQVSRKAAQEAKKASKMKKTVTIDERMHRIDRMERSG